eukprot:7630020-Pyramimonas_sp.AAC.1
MQERPATTNDSERLLHHQVRGQRRGGSEHGGTGARHCARLRGPRHGRAEVYPVSVQNGVELPRLERREFCMSSVPREFHLQVGQRGRDCCRRQRSKGHPAPSSAPEMQRAGTAASPALPWRR